MFLFRNICRGCATQDNPSWHNSKIKICTELNIRATEGKKKETKMYAIHTSWKENTNHKTETDGSGHVDHQEEEDEVPRSEGEHGVAW